MLSLCSLWARPIFLLLDFQFLSNKYNRLIWHAGTHWNPDLGLFQSQAPGSPGFPRGFPGPSVVFLATQTVLTGVPGTNGSKDNVGVVPYYTKKYNIVIHHLGINMDKQSTSALSVYPKFKWCIIHGNKLGQDHPCWPQSLCVTTG